MSLCDKSTRKKMRRIDFDLIFSYLLLSLFLLSALKIYKFKGHNPFLSHSASFNLCGDGPLALNKAFTLFSLKLNHKFSIFSFVPIVVAAECYDDDMMEGKDQKSKADMDIKEELSSFEDVFPVALLEEMATEAYSFDLFAQAAGDNMRFGKKKTFFRPLINKRLVTEEDLYIGLDNKDPVKHVVDSSAENIKKENIKFKGKYAAKIPKNRYFGKARCFSELAIEILYEYLMDHLYRYPDTLTNLGTKVNLSNVHDQTKNLTINLVGAEWWYQTRGEKESIGFHYDKDEGLASNSMIMRTPLFSTITYIRDIGAPTLVLNQRTRENGNVDIPLIPTEGYLIFPKQGKHVIFPGDMMHGVGGPLGKSEKDLKKRITFLVNWFIDDIPLEPNTIELKDRNLQTLGVYRPKVVKQFVKDFEKHSFSNVRLSHDQESLFLSRRRQTYLNNTFMRASSENEIDSHTLKTSTVPNRPTDSSEKKIINERENKNHKFIPLKMENSDHSSKDTLMSGKGFSKTNTRNIDYDSSLNELNIPSTKVSGCKQKVQSRKPTKNVKLKLHPADLLIFGVDFDSLELKKNYHLFWHNETIFGNFAQLNLQEQNQVQALFATKEHKVLLFFKEEKGMRNSDSNIMSLTDPINLEGQYKMNSDFVGNEEEFLQKLQHLGRPYEGYYKFYLADPSTCSDAMRVFGIYEHHLPAIALHQTAPQDRKIVIKNWNGDVNYFVKQLDNFLHEDGQNREKAIGQRYLDTISNQLSSSLTTKSSDNDREEYSFDL